MTGEFNIAVHGLVFLGHKECTVSSEELAENICTNPARVRKIMAKLKKYGLVETKEGKNGGYVLNKAPEHINLEQILDAVQVEPVEVSWRSGDQNMDCMVASGMAYAMDRIYGELNKTCRKKLKAVSVRQVEEMLSLS
ncbi:MAG: Rrf2 family transcriptional regulator [Clostridiales bacterium]|nr:Rrf2 family transcriptional regulator [Clostridiales bacterium]